MTKPDANPFQKCPQGNRFQGTVRSLKATLKPKEDWFSLVLSPARPVDVAAVWTELVHVPSAKTLVFNDPRPDVVSATPVATVAKRLGLETVDVFDDRHIVIEDASLESLVAALDSSSVMAVRIDGPIEPLDASAIDRAIVGGGSALEAELRALVAVQFTDDGVVLECRRRSSAIQLVAESFRQYLGAVLATPANEVTSPDLWQLARVLDVTGSVLVRPIETDVLPGSVDVGICTDVHDASGPATRSLVYDRPSDSWHDEP